jgi:medium-chain acyl-[acyl-carrier-protein] hydrolase
MIAVIHKKEFQVRAIEIDGSGLIQPIPLVDYILEAAGEHAGSGGLGVTDLFKRGVTWVLSRFHVEIARYPRWGERVEIRTWPSGKAPLFAVRDYEIAGEAGPVGTATSSWLIVDLKTRRPVRTAEHLEGFPLLEKRALADDFASLPALERTDLVKEFPVFFSDIDINRHVTATVYIHRALESVPDEILFGFRPSGIEVNFRGEAFYGDGLRSRTERLPGDGAPRFLHRLTRAADDKELTLLRTSWAPAK